MGVMIISMLDNGMGYNKKEQNKVYWAISKTVLLVYYTAFFWVSYSIFQECRHDRDFWIITDIFNGIMGGIVLVYPFNVIRYGWFETYNRWKQWFVFIFLLTTLSFIIGQALGIGVM